MSKLTGRAHGMLAPPPPIGYREMGKATPRWQLVNSAHVTFVAFSPTF